VSIHTRSHESLLMSDKCTYSWLGHLSMVNWFLILTKISNIHTWPLPTTGKTVSRYLGFFNYFRSSIPMYATLAAKLDSLRNYKSLENIWTDKHTRAFRNLQTTLASAPVLSPPDFRYRLHVVTDASNSGTGGIIYYIKREKGTLHCYGKS
jgi:hypothetical protein